MSSDTLIVDPDAGVEYLSLAAAAALMPGRPHLSTVWRHATRGIRRGDEVIRLRTLSTGGRRYTRRDWIEQYLARLSDDVATSQSAPAPAPSGRALQSLGC